MLQMLEAPGSLSPQAGQRSWLGATVAGVVPGADGSTTAAGSRVDVAGWLGSSGF